MARDKILRKKFNENREKQSILRKRLKREGNPLAVTFDIIAFEYENIITELLKIKT